MLYKSLFSIILYCLLTLKPALHLAGAEPSKDVVFTQFSVNTIQYTVADGRPLLMDIYQPVGGDTTALRPLVILAHGGSFLSGNRRTEYEERVPAICRQLALRGYVAVSIDYRLSNLVGMATKKSAYKEIMQSVADGRCSVAWFVNDITKRNTYRIDKNKLFFGGNSAGGILAEQLAFLDSDAVCKPVLQKAIRKYLNNVCPLPPHTLRGVISLAGAVLDTNIIHPSPIAVLHIQGDADHVVPYGYKRAISGLAPFKLAGLGADRARYISCRLNFKEYVFKNAGHTPWDKDDDAFNIVFQQLLTFLQKETK